jgi:sec-independent protein translocase protein TatA
VCTLPFAVVNKSLKYTCFWYNDPKSRIIILKEERMFGIGMPELIVILVIVLIIFGAGKLPQIGEGIGKGIRNFRKATTKDEEIDVTPKKTEEISEKK